MRNSEWDSGDHRRRCAYQNQRELLDFPQPYEAYCPNCYEQLRLWPAKGHPFYCDECPFDQRNVLKRSTGHNRLNCFLCDFDCCVNCANEDKFPNRSIQTKQSEPAGISDDDLYRMASAMAVETLSETEPHQQPAHSYNPHQQQKTAGISDEDLYRMASAMAVETVSETEPHQQPSYNYNPYQQQKTADNDHFRTGTVRESDPHPPPAYNYNTHPLNPNSTATPAGMPGSFNSPFIIIPQEGNPPPYPANQYHDSPFTNPSHPNISVPSNPSSLPYPIQPSQPTESASTSAWAPSAPPLINKY